MDYTQSDSYDTDAGTGHRYHEDAKAIPTIWSGKDANSLLWSLMEIVNAAGLAPKQFNKADASTYGVLLSALRSAGVFQTAAQFDSTTKAATTGFVQKALGNFSGSIAYSSNTTLENTDIGRVIVAGSSAAAMTWTPPDVTTIADGSAFTVLNLSGFALNMVQRRAADRYMSAFDPSNTALNFSVPFGGLATFVKYGNGWLVTGSSSELRGPMFAASFTGSGYQKLPSGLIIQWGGQSVAGGASTVFNYPIAFPNESLRIVGSCMVPGGTAAYNYTTVSNSQYRAENTAASTRDGSFIAIGR
jgi:hypothetical protein